MYLHTAHYYPASGKAAEVRTSVEELTKLRHGQGLDASLSSTIYGPETAFHLTIRFAELGALDKFRAEQMGANATIAARMTPLMRQTSSPTLSERLVDPLPATAPAKYQSRITYRPALGKGAELRALLVEYAKARQAQGIRMGAAFQVAGPESGTYVLPVVVESLAKYEEYRAALTSNPAVQGFGGKVAALTMAPGTTEIREILVPYPTR